MVLKKMCTEPIWCSGIETHRDGPVTVIGLEAESSHTSKALQYAAEVGTGGYCAQDATCVCVSVRACVFRVAYAHGYTVSHKFTDSIACLWFSSKDRLRTYTAISCLHGCFSSLSCST